MLNSIWLRCIIAFFFIIINNCELFAQQVFVASENSSAWDGGHHVAGNCFVKYKGRLHLLYYAANGSSSTSIGLARKSGKKGFVRVVAGPVLKPGAAEEWDSGGVSVFPGCIIQRKDGSFWMYYSGIKKGESDFYWHGNSGIGLAISKDLIHWEKSASNPILLPEHKYTWESEGVFEPSIIFTGDDFGGKGAFRMYYGGNDLSGRMSIGYAESINGIDHWVKYKGNPILKHGDEYAFDSHTIEVHHTIKVFGQYLLFYEGTDRKFPSRFSIGLACSKNGRDFKKVGVIHEGGMVGDWDSMGAYHPSLVWLHGVYYLYYVGLNYRFDHSIGMVELKKNPAEYCK